MKPLLISAADNDNPLETIKNYLEELGLHAPGWVISIVTVLLLLAALGGLAKPLWPVLRYGLVITKWATRRRLGAEQRRQRRRRTFAKHLNNQLLQLELQEDWRDEKYAELEAEVEIERSWRYRWMRLLLPFRAPALRRVRSLSKALAESSESLILLEGEPGAGKSIAMRHLARTMAQQAARSNNPQKKIPLYLNLKGLNVRPPDVSPDKIREFVLTALTDIKSRDVQEVLDDSFEHGMKEGTWLFLFDSFDEIPDILSADNARHVAPKYAQAIAAFLGPFNRCRGIVASRDFSTPDITQFTRFRILRLSRRQQSRLIKRADLDQPVDRSLRAGLTTASTDVSTFAGNPMFLSLLCEHMKNGRGFPMTSHAVFEEYLAHRLLRDAERIRSRYGVTAEFVRAGAEEVAFAIASTPGIGLRPTRTALMERAAAMQRISPAVLNTVLDALEYSKLGRDTTASGGDTFEFMHRRFQEYFATCVVIGDSQRVPVAALFDNDQWRETAVTLLQVQNAEAAELLMTEACRRLHKYAAHLDKDNFQWSPGCRHLLGILATGLETHPEKITNDMRAMVDQVVQCAWDKGHRLDKRRALAFLGLASPSVAERLLTEAFRSRNEFLREGAFRTAGSLAMLSDNLRGQIRRSLLGLAGTFELYTKRTSTAAQIRRLAHPSEFLRITRLLAIAFPFALALSIGGMIAALVVFFTSLRSEPGVSIVAAAVIVAGMILIAAGWIVGLLFSFAGLNRGGRLVTSIPLGATLKTRVVRLFVRLLLLWLYAIFCLISTTAILRLNAFHSVPAWAIIAYLAYAILWPASVCWTCRTGIGTHPLTWPFLPALLVTTGLFRLPRFIDLQVEQLRSTSPRPIRTIVRTMVEIIRTTLRKTPTIVLGIALYAAFVLALFGYLGTIGSVSAQIAGAAGAIFFVTVILAIAIISIAMYRRASRARTSTDLLSLIARAPWGRTLNLLINRFRFQRIGSDPMVSKTIETLVGEIERAQLQAENDSRLVMRVACPSLADGKLTNWPILDSFPLRHMTRLKVRSIREETIDDLARLAEADFA